MSICKILPRKCLLFILAVGLCVALLSAARTQSAQAGSVSTQGIILTPAIENLDLQKGQAAAKFIIMVTNNTKNNETLNISSVDFKSLNDSGGVAFIGNNTGQLAHKYGLASWLDVPHAIQLAAHQTKPVAVIVENRPDLSPGGHYAAVLFQANGSGSTGNHVALNQVISTLVFVRKIEGERYGVDLTRVAGSTGWFHIPTNLDLFFKNTGNIQTIPRGLVTVSSPPSHEVARGIINTDSSLVLPESTRLMRTTLFSTGHAWLPGRYHVRVVYHYDGSSSLAVYDTTLLYVDLPFWGVCCAVAVILWQITKKIKLFVRRRRKPPASPRSKSKRIIVRID